MGLAASRSHTPFALPATPMSETPDWSQVATKADLKEVKQEIKTLRWFMVAGLILLSALSDRAAALVEYAMQFL